MYPKSLKKLIDHFAFLPGVGPKMAERLVLFLYRQDDQILEDFSISLKNLKHELKVCSLCYHLSDNHRCSICEDKTRDSSILCVVEEPLDIFAIEKTRQFKGLYHVLGGVLEIGKNKNNQNLRIEPLQKRIALGNIREIILAFNPTTEGDATALYLERFLKDPNVRITRLARGLGTGSDIEYADELTLSSAILYRK